MKNKNKENVSIGKDLDKTDVDLKQLNDDKTNLIGLVEHIKKFNDDLLQDLKDKSLQLDLNKMLIDNYEKQITELTEKITKLAGDLNA